MSLWRMEMSRKIYLGCRLSPIQISKRRNLRIVTCVTPNSRCSNHENIVTNVDSRFANSVRRIWGGCRNKKINNTQFATTAITKCQTVCSRKNWKTIFYKNKNWHDRLKNTFKSMRKNNENLSQPNAGTILNGKTKRRKSESKKRKFKSNWMLLSRKKRRWLNKMKNWTCKFSKKKKKFQNKSKKSKRKKCWTQNYCKPKTNS